MSDDTAQAISERSLRERAAFHALLDALLEYVDARADTPEAQTLADESVRLVWMSGLDGRGPDTALLLWLAEHPEIWRRTLPDDVVIAPRKLIADIVACLPPSPLGGLGANTRQ